MMVSVIAPHWRGRFRRNKKGLVGTAMGEPEQEAQDSEQEVGEGSTLCSPQEKTADPQNQPAGQRGEIFSPVASPQTPTSPHRPLSLQLHTHRRMSQAGHRGDQPSSLSSKPTTSSILLSLRRFNSNWMNSNIGSTHSDATLSSLTNDGAPGSPTTHPSPTSPINDGESEQLNFVLSSSSSSCRLPQISRLYPTQSYSAKQTILFSGQERLFSTERPDLNRTAEVDLTPSQTSPRGHADFWKSRCLPRGTMLNSTSWWKHAEESDCSPCSPLSPTTTTTTTTNNINNNRSKNTNKDNTSLFSFPSSNENDSDPQTENSNASCSHQNINNINNNNLSQSATPSNLVLRDTQITTCPHRRSEAQDLPDQRSHTSLLTQPRPADSLSQKARSLSSASCSPKISNALSPVTFSSSTIDLTRPEISFDYRPCSPESYTSTSLSTSPQTSNTPDSHYTSLNSRLSCRPQSLHRACPGKTAGNQDYLSMSSKSPTPSSILSSQRSTEKRTPISRSFSLASYTPKPFSTNTSVLRPIFLKTSTSTKPPPPLTASSIPAYTSQPLHPKPTSTSTKPPLPFKVTPTTIPQDNSFTLRDTTFTDSLVLSPKKQCTLVEGRVMAERANASSGRSGSSESPPAMTSPLSPSRPLRSVEGPCIFACLRPGSPSWAVSPLSPQGARTSSLQVWRGDRETQREEMEGRENERERDECSILSGSSRFNFNPLERGRSTGGPRSEDRTFFLHSASSISLPLDEYSGSTLHLSSPPYQSLKANSPHQDEVKCSTLTPGSPYYKPLTSPSNSLPMSPLTSPPKPLPTSPLYSLPISPPISPYSSQISQQGTRSAQDSSKVVATETDSVNNNYHTTQTNRAIQDAGAPHPPPHIDIPSPQSLPLAAVEEMFPPPSSRTTVIETLVYTIPKASSYAGSTNCVRLTHSYIAMQGPHTYTITKASTSELSPTSQRSLVTGHPSCQSQQSSNESRVVDDQCPPTAQAEAERDEREGRQRDSIPVLERKISTAPSKSSKRGLFGLKVKKDSVVSSTPAAGLTRERDMREKERGQKETQRGQRRELEKGQSRTTKIDLFSRLKQTFNVKRCDDVLLTSRQQKRASLTTSDPGVTPGGEVTAEQGRQREEERLQESKISPKLSSGQWKRDERGGDRFYVGADGVGVELGNRSTETIENKCSQFCVFRGESVDESRQWPSMMNFTPTEVHERDRLDDGMDGRVDGRLDDGMDGRVDGRLDDGMDGRVDGRLDDGMDGRVECQSRRLPPYREHSPTELQPWTTNLPATLPTRRSSSASPRNPNSPFSLGHKRSHSSPLSPFSSGGQVSASSSPLSREEWGRDSVFLSPILQPPERRAASSLCVPVEKEEARGHGLGVRGQDRGRLASFSSCADLKYGLEAGRSFSVSSVLSSRPSGPGRISTGTRFASVNDLTDPAMTFGEGDSITSKSDFRSESKSKSLPRSLLRSSTWGSEPPGRSTTPVTSIGQVWDPPCLDSSHFLWDTGGPLTPPPSPPWSPASQRMSRPTSSSSLSSTPSSAGSRGLHDSQTTRGRLPTRGYFSSLSAFDESGQDQDSDSDASSNTTTDDEYYLGGEGDEEEKETEL